MVARINTSKNISRALNYNEQKIIQNKAEILFAKNFLKDASDVNFYDKLRHFEKLISLNEKTTTNALHVSLNFDPLENLSNEKLTAIAESYMDKIGFGKQPFLVYRHYDSGHPHIHIVSTNIEIDGKRISMHNLGKNQSEGARKEIEFDFDLVRAEDKKNVDAAKIQPVNASKAVYGRSETRRAISNVLGPVLNQYKFTSLAELNAVLKLYNITADRGPEGSRMHERNGLSYHMLDENGNKIGIGVKASSFFMRPTLKTLQKKFSENEAARQPHKKRITANIDWILNRKNISFEQFMRSLEKENISVVIRQNKDGFIYGMTYVDHRTKAVFNGSDLGKHYASKAIQERCGHPEKIKPKKEELLPIKQRPIEKEKAEMSPQNISDEKHNGIFAELIQPLQENNFMPHQLKKRKKKKRKRMSL